MSSISQVKFGSSEALREMLESLVPLQQEEEDHTSGLPVQIEEGEWTLLPNYREISHYAFTQRPAKIIDARSSSTSTSYCCFCCLECGRGQDTSSSWETSHNELTMLWSRLQYEEQDASVSVRYVEESSTEVAEEELGLNLEPPINAPPSTACGECGASLLSARALIGSPPGYCEYSGKLICGDCFEPRQPVVPWKLLKGLSSARGNVSKESAKFIQTKYFSAIEIDPIKQQQIHKVVYLENLRTQVCEKLRNLSGICSQLDNELKLIALSLPFHMRYNKDTRLYSLGDLVDILSPSAGGRSRIVLAFQRSLLALDSHCCTGCEAKITRTCEICLESLRISDSQHLLCKSCDASFHRNCMQKSTDGCPVCANR